MSEPEVECREFATADFGKLQRQDYRDGDKIATSVFRFSAAEQRLMENRMASLASPYRVRDDGGFDDNLRIKEINFATPGDDVKSEKQTEGPTAGTRSQYHSIQQLSQSGRPRESPDPDTGVSQACLASGRPRFPVDVTSDVWNVDEDAHHVLRSLFRYYDRFAGTEDRTYDDSDELESDVGARTSNSDLREFPSDEEPDNSQATAAAHQTMLKRDSSTSLHCDERQAKRARVEHIVSNIRTPSCIEDLTVVTGTSDNVGEPPSLELTTGDGRRRSKRKQTVPQQHESGAENHHGDRRHESIQFVNDLSDDDLERRTPSPADCDDSLVLRHQLQTVQSRLENVYAKYARSLHHSPDFHAPGLPSPDHVGSEASVERPTNEDAERLTDHLKEEVRHTVDGLVEAIVRQFVTKYFPGHHPSAASSKLAPLSDDRPQHDLFGTRMSSATPLPVFPPPPPPLLAPFPFPVGGDLLTLRQMHAKRCAFADTIMQRARAACVPEQEGGATFNFVSNSGPTHSAAVTSSSTEPAEHRAPMSGMPPRCFLTDQRRLEQPRPQDQFVTPTSAGLSVNTMPAGPQKKKRTKVTDTRLSPRVARALLQDGLTCHHGKVSMDPTGRRLHNQHHQHSQAQQHSHLPPVATDLSMRQAICPSSVGPTIYGSDLHHHQKLETGNLLHHESHHHHHHHRYQHQYHQQRASSVRDSFRPASRDGRRAADGVQEFDTVAASGCHQTSPDSAAQRTSLQRHPGTNFAASQSDRACVDRYDYVLLGYDQFAKITLTPMHLRKAKLMFFYVRYPSSAILKVYFPDVKFNKNNTAQLVKWFSNFREFFYIQMEKYARQSLSEGLKNVSEIVVRKDDELYRVLVLHYNRNNQIEVPENFRFVVQATLREFYLAIASQKDVEQSWKKAIYKVIARMDDTIPEYFKSPNWMQQLLDG